MTDVQMILDFIKACEKLKTTPRAASQLSDGTRESVAEHSWRVALMAECFLDYFPDVDRERVIKMCLIHDLAEMITGDESAKYQTDPEAKHREELEAITEVFSSLPEKLSKEFLEIFEEYNACETPTSLFVKAMDKAETVTEQNQAVNPPDFDYEFNLGYGKNFFEKDETLQQLRSLIDADTRRRILERITK